MARDRHPANLIVALVVATFMSSVAIASDRPVRSMYSDPKVFLDAIAREQPQASRDSRITGISVPHHLLAADLIARGFWTALPGRYDRIILLSPDHFHR